MQIKRIGRCCVALSLACPVAANAGPLWDELANGGGDAGHLISNAQITVGIGALGTIKGSLANGNDMEDVFKIRITDPLNFSATTTTNPFGTSGFDTQLWLFNA